MKYSFYLLCVILLCFAATFILNKIHIKVVKNANVALKPTVANNSFNNTKIHAVASNKAISLLPYLKSKKYSQQYCFLVNMKLPSGTKRFFVYDFINDSIVHSGLVTHGSGSNIGNGQLSFSNIPNSLATSLGKYQIGKPYMGKFGLAYKLMGLEASNSKAFERFVVLHAHDCVPTNDVYPALICESWGCPTVNPSYLQTLKKYIDGADKPIVLWIYY